MSISTILRPWSNFVRPTDKLEEKDVSMDEDSSEEPEDEDLEQTSKAANTSHPEFGFELYGVETLINLFNFFSVDSLLLIQLN
jgi:hypothetical protein